MAVLYIEAVPSSEPSIVSHETSSYRCIPRDGQTVIPHRNIAKSAMAVQSPKLCSTCRNENISLQFADHPKTCDDAASLNFPGSFSRSYKVKVSALKTSVASGCPWCRMVLEDLRPEWNDLDDSLVRVIYTLDCPKSPHDVHFYYMSVIYSCWLPGQQSEHERERSTYFAYNFRVPNRRVYSGDRLTPMSYNQKLVSWLPSRSPFNHTKTSLQGWTDDCISIRGST